ncbi:MAG: uroporphyrinogen decarboxylase [Gammaproteobacteria bacterium]|nr:uroporphyrinogen decarboxylase [Gammaproteobacteria bacterium]MBT6734041.1 uroporphyrinogen decarboxylase [Gammaproteobacteria bacterium]
MPLTPDYLLLKAIRNEPIDRTPIWIMRQAGRYLPEYINLKNKAGGFINLVKNPELACEITLQPLKRFELDSAIVFSDILVVADMMGIKLSFVENKGPVFDKVIRTEKDLDNIEQIHNIEKLDYVFNTIKLLKKELSGKKPLIGFIGSPWTVATYIIEGNSSKTFANVRKMLEGDEKLLHGILDMLTNISISYLNKQIEAGIDVAMIFDTWGSLLNDEQYEKFSLRYINKIKHSISNQDIPLIYYVRETDKKLEALKSLDIDVLGIDSTTEIGVIKKQIGDKFALQGNLDVNILKKDEKDIIIEIKKILTSYGSNSGHVFNLGTGITPDINPDKVKILIDNLADISSKINVK